MNEQHAERMKYITSVFLYGTTEQSEMNPAIR